MLSLATILPGRAQGIAVLLQKYGALGSDELTPEIVGEFIEATGTGGPDVSSAQFSEVLETLKEANINKIADLVGQPSTLGKVMEIFTPKTPPRDRLFNCTSCGNLNFLPERE